MIRVLTQDHHLHLADADPAGPGPHLGWAGVHSLTPSLLNQVVWQLSEPVFLHHTLQRWEPGHSDIFGQQGKFFSHLEKLSSQLVVLASCLLLWTEGRCFTGSISFVFKVVLVITLSLDWSKRFSFFQLSFLLYLKKWIQEFKFLRWLKCYFLPQFYYQLLLQNHFLWS